MATTSGQDMVQEIGDSNGRGTTNDGLEQGLRRLEALGASLRRLGRVNTVLAAASLGIMLLVGADKAVLSMSAYEPERGGSLLAGALPIACMIGLLCSFAGILCLIAWERRRRMGGALFMQLSDALESRYRLAHAGGLSPQSEAEGNRIRALFRSYLNSATLPFTPEDSSGMGYLAFHAVLVIVLVEFIFHFT